jgi:Maintenance of mitochondrial morphology protein 1
LPKDAPDVELFSRFNPIALQARDDVPHEVSCFYIYCSTGSEKEDWFVILKRCSKLPEFADDEALSAFYQELGPMRAYTAAMEKLIQHTAAADTPESQATAWLNAIVGRLFVAVHTNSHVKEWLTSRLSRRSVETKDEGFLGDIHIQNLNVGNSLPVLSNPKLLSISVDGDMMVEMDIDYTGGVSVEAATQATLSVPAWDAYMKPITVYF